MSDVAPVRVHLSQFPDAVQRDLISSLRTRRVNHKFHYDSVKQTQKWLALHEAYSPSRRDPDCVAIYERGFAAAAARVKGRRVHLIGLGCGGGQKDTRLLSLMRSHGRETLYTPCDVSTAMVLVARQTALEIIEPRSCFPFVCDLATAENPGDYLATPQPSLVTFFGMIPNFEPQQILPKLAALIRPRDLLLLSANLAPGDDYGAGMKKILPQYDNSQTREWLMTFLLDLGIERRSGKIDFGIESGVMGLQRIVARFRFSRSCSLNFAGHRFVFSRGEAIRLFFSYRFTPKKITGLFEKNGLQVLGDWTTRSGEEAVFLCSR